MTSSRGQKRPSGLGLFLITGACLILPASAVQVTAADGQARAATLFAGATPAVLGVAMVLVLAAAIMTAAGRPGPIASAGLVLAALVFAVVAIGLVTHGSPTFTAGVVLLPAAVLALVFARIAAKVQTQER